MTRTQRSWVETPPPRGRGVARVSRPVRVVSEAGRLLAAVFRKREQARGLRAGPNIGFFRLIRRGLVVGVLGAARAAHAAPAPDDGWQNLAGYLFRDAHGAFSRAPIAGDRPRALGVAASLLNEPPVSPGKVADVEAQLRQLMADNSADDPAIYARYLLARIAHLHRPAETAEVEAAYRAVVTAAPAHPLAQLAAGKLALVLLYQRPDLPVPERIAGAAALAPVAGAEQLPETASSYYRALAEAALYYNVLDDRVLGWLQRADAIGTHDIMTATSLRIQLAEVARALGHREEALGYYRQYLATAVRTDSRYLTAKEHMTDLAKETK